MKFVLVFIIILISFSSYLFSQNAEISGKIFDTKTQETLPGANIFIENGLGTTTDVNGNYNLKLPPGKYSIKFSFIGYIINIKHIEVKANEKKNLNVSLLEDSKLLDMIVVTGSAYEKKLSNEIASIDVIKPDLMKNCISTDISQAIEKVPGVKITDGQTSIRGGSGYSYGTGSRVQVIVDGQSYLSPDLGEVRWKFVPIDNVEQVEIIKGASSVLYGSSSMNGVVNILTGWGTKEPKVTCRFYQGFYSLPKRYELAWWDRESEEIHIPNFSGTNLNYKQQFGNLDVVVGGNLYSSSSYLKEIDEYRAGINTKIRYRFKKIKGLTAGINANFMYERYMNFLFFQDADTGGYIPFDGSLTHMRMGLLSICPYVTYYTPRGNKHTLRMMYFKVNTIKSEKYNRYTESTPAQMINLSYQYQIHLRENTVLTSGIDASYGWMKNNYLYYGVEPATFFAGIFTQLEQKFDRLTLQAGIRDELYGITNIKGINPDVYGDIDFNTIVQTSNPSFRGGLNYRITKSTFYRASYGQAYRFPAISETFLNGSIAGAIKIYPNTDIKPETGWNIETGIKQEVKISNWKGYLDLALFWMEFKNYITYEFGKYGEGSDLSSYGFKAKNVSRARISGLELTGVGEGMIGPISFNLYGGYTFVYPGDLQSDTSQIRLSKYFENLWHSATGDSINVNSILPYRNRHIFRFDAEAFYNKFGIGLTVNYNSQIERIDDYFVLFNIIIKGINTYTEKYNEGSWLFDGRISYTYKGKHKITFLVKNITNHEYADRPGLIGPPRSYLLQYNLDI